MEKANNCSNINSQSRRPPPTTKAKPTKRIYLRKERAVGVSREQTSLGGDFPPFQKEHSILRHLLRPPPPSYFNLPLDPTERKMRPTKKGEGRRSGVERDASGWPLLPPPSPQTPSDTTGSLLPQTKRKNSFPCLRSLKDSGVMRQKRDGRGRRRGGRRRSLSLFLFPPS